jgi:hypothetical protein
MLFYHLGGFVRLAVSNDVSPVGLAPLLAVQRPTDTRHLIFDEPSICDRRPQRYSRDTLSMRTNLRKHSTKSPCIIIVE